MIIITVIITDKLHYHPSFWLALACTGILRETEEIESYACARRVRTVLSSVFVFNVFFTTSIRVLQPNAIWDLQHVNDACKFTMEHV